MELMTREGAAEVEFDPFSEQYFNGAYSTFREMRDHAPVYRNDDRNFYALSRYDDVFEAFRDMETYISGQGVLLDQLNTPGFNGNESMPGFLISYDAPGHTRLRHLALPGLTRRSVEALEAPVRGTAAALFDELSGRTEFDLVVDFANRFPVEVLYALMGVPADERETLYDLAMGWVHAGDPADPETEQNHFNAMINLMAYTLDITQRKRVSPGNDLISRMISADFVDADGASRPVTDEEMCGYLVLLFAAGVETTTKLIAASVVAFHRHPDQWRKVLDDPSKLPAAIEEVGRYDPAVHYIGRKTTRPVTLHGITIPAQSNVLLLIGSANRDERAFPDPEAFDVDRVMTRKPLSFGYGPHLCLGAHLARVETRIAVQEFARRWPSFTVDEANLSRAAAISACGYSEVPVRVGDCSSPAG